jgi:hypothetical protein
MYLWMHSEKEKTLNAIAPLSIGLVVFPVTILLGIYYYKKMQTKRAFSVTALGAVLVNGIFFSVLFPALDAQGSVQQQKQLVQTSRPVIAWHNFNEAFTFYHRQPIPVMQSADEVAAFLKTHPDALVLERSGEPHLTDSLPGMVLKASGKDLFSRQHSFVYELKTTP